MTDLEKEKNEKIKLLKQFGKHLVKVRGLKNLTAAELARCCFMERSSIARLESGRTNPSIFILHKLSKGLNVSISELLDGFK